MLHLTLLILSSNMSIAMFYQYQKLHSALLTLFTVMPIVISYFLKILNNLTRLMEMLFEVTVCFLLLLSYMCCMVKSFLEGRTSFDQQGYTYLRRTCCSRLERTRMEKFKSGIFMFAFTTMAFSVACAVALAVALCRTICMGFHIYMPCF
jgi:hypothetical protein